MRRWRWRAEHRCLHTWWSPMLKSWFHLGQSTCRYLEVPVGSYVEVPSSTYESKVILKVPLLASLQAVRVASLQKDLPHSRNHQTQWVASTEMWFWWSWNDFNASDILPLGSLCTHNKFSRGAFKIRNVLECCQMIIARHHHLPTALMAASLKAAGWGLRGISDFRSEAVFCCQETSHHLFCCTEILLCCESSEAQGGCRSLHPFKLSNCPSWSYNSGTHFFQCFMFCCDRLLILNIETEQAKISSFLLG